MKYPIILELYSQHIVLLNLLIVSLIILINFLFSIFKKKKKNV
jgi:hypothetical protein